MADQEPAIALIDLAPYLYRFVRVVYHVDGVNLSERGFLTEIASNEVVLDQFKIIPQQRIVRVFNIAGELIAGQEN